MPIVSTDFLEIRHLGHGGGGGGATLEIRCEMNGNTEGQRDANTGPVGMLSCPHTRQDAASGPGSVGLGRLCPKKALLCYAAMPAGRSIMLNPEAYYAWNMPTYAYDHLARMTTHKPRMHVY